MPLVTDSLGNWAKHADIYVYSNLELPTEEETYEDLYFVLHVEVVWPDGSPITLKDYAPSFKTS